METGKQPGKEIRRKYKKYGLKKMEKYVKEEENAGKNGNLLESGDEYEIEMMKKLVESDGEEGGETGKPQWQKYGKSERKYRKYGLQKMGKYVKEEENAGKNGNLFEPGDGNEIGMMKKGVELDGEEGGETGEPQRKKCSEVKAISENSNSSNTAITVQLLEEQVRRMKTLEKKIRAETVETLNGKRMESENNQEIYKDENTTKYGLKSWHRI